MIKFLRRLASGFRREDGTATVEFVLAVPVLMTIFMASFESGMFMVRHVMLDQALDHTMRELRLGKMGTVTPDKLRTSICNRTVIMIDCAASLRVELQPVNTASWALPAQPTRCVNRGDPSATPFTDPLQGGSNEPMIVRVCIVQEPIFPLTGIGLRMPKDDLGGYSIVAMSVFANEPR